MLFPNSNQDNNQDIVHNLDLDHDDMTDLTPTECKIAWESYLLLSLSVPDHLANQKIEWNLWAPATKGL
jgi:hypothetical protein